METETPAATAPEPACAAAPDRDRVADFCARYGISRATFDRWREVYGALGETELKRLEELEERTAVQGTAPTDPKRDEKGRRPPRTAAPPDAGK